MSKVIKKHLMLTLIVVLLSVIMLPASAYASSNTSSGTSASKFTATYASSFFSSIANSISSLFDKKPSVPSYTDNNQDKGHSGWLDWLSGKKQWGDNFWDDKKHDSYKLWDKYYCY